MVSDSGVEITGRAVPRGTETMTWSKAPHRIAKRSVSDPPDVEREAFAEAPNENGL